MIDFAFAFIGWACFGVGVAMLLKVRAVRLGDIETMSVAPGEWYRVRRSWRTTMWPIKVLGGVVFVLVSLSTVRGFLDVAFFGVSELIAAVVGGVFVCVIYAVFVAGLMPTMAFDCMVRGSELVYSEFGQRFEIPRSEARVRLRKAQTCICPYVAQIYFKGKKREVGLDPEGVAVLRGLGWVEEA